ncbi:MAG TPA: dihydrodipicolinate synthase family protein [Sphaerochaeta sp.]|nr:dihydrodipicolinate synthase family protein [Sphaerochaeta sp.]
MKKMYGVVPPMITPFKENGDLDIDGLKALVGFLSDHVEGLFVTGSYGGGPLMSLEERKKVVEVSVKTSAGRVPIIPMVGTTNTKDSIDLAQHAEVNGAVAVAAVGPYYFTHKEDELVQYYTDLVESVKIPVYLYNNPGFQGYPIGIETIKKLKAHGLAGIKDATFDILTHANYHRILKDDDFDVALGTEAMFASACVLGCRAFIPGLANAFPEINKKMFEAGIAGDLDTCSKTQFKINELRDVMYLARSTQLAIYAMLEIRGVLKTYPRKPFLPATETEATAIKKELLRLEMI